MPRTRPTLIAVVATAVLALATPPAASAVSAVDDASARPSTDDHDRRGVAAAGSRVAPYLPVDPPVLLRDGAGDATVFRASLAKTDLTRRQARAADVLRTRFDAVDHDGEPSAQVAVTFRRLLPGRDRRTEQRAQVYFDEETYLELAPRVGEAAYRSSSGGRPTSQPGCLRLDARTVGTTVTTWLPVRCLLDDSSEMTVDSTVRGTRTGRDPGTRGSWARVGSDGSYPRHPYIRWR